MRVEFEITYDAGKLEKEMKSIIKDFMRGTSKAFFVGSKRAILKGNFKPLAESTKRSRRSGKKPVTHDRPLIHTGKFFKGIKLLKNGDISVHKYALNHLPADIWDMSEESVTSKVVAEAKRKSGLAYKNVPIRNWFRMDKNLAKKSLARFEKLIKKKFARKTPISFSRFAR